MRKIVYTSDGWYDKAGRRFAKNPNANITVRVTVTQYDPRQKGRIGASMKNNCVKTCLLARFKDNANMLTKINNFDWTP